jgi:hypothetical protein
MRVGLGAAAAAVILAACGGGEAAKPDVGAGSVTTPPGVTATTAAPESTKATPDAVLAGLKAAGLPVTLIVTYDEATDPNKLLGRPSGYEGKNAFSDSRLAPDASVARDAIERGGSVEVYPTADGAEARAKYIQAIGAPTRQ